jgi:hypothetical protein
VPEAHNSQVREGNTDRGRYRHAGKDRQLQPIADAIGLEC